MKVKLIFNKREIEKMRRAGHTLKDINTARVSYEKELLEKAHDLHYWSFEQDFHR